LFYDSRNDAKLLRLTASRSTSDLFLLRKNILNKSFDPHVALMERPLPGDAPEVQEVIRRHHAWLKQFWTPTRERYAGHSQVIVDSDLHKAYEASHPQLPEFMAAAIKVFAEKELS
jgi:hypothetical protein